MVRQYNSEMDKCILWEIHDPSTLERLALGFPTVGDIRLMEKTLNLR